MLKTYLKFIVLINLVLAPNILGIEHINSVCDEGYVLSVFNECEPVCDPECGEYSSCVKPQTCECHWGYLMNTQTRECELECDSDMYVFDKSTNQCVLKQCPCSEGGHCPGNSTVCVCNPGYIKVSYNTCEPKCEPKCENAFCRGPNRCKCWPGYEATQKSNICAPTGKELMTTSGCQCKIDYIPYVIGIIALAVSLALAALKIVERRVNYYINGEPENHPMPLVEYERTCQ